MIRVGKKFSKPDLSRVINGDISNKDDTILEKKERLDLILVKKYPDYKRATLQKFIKLKAVTVNGKVCEKANFLIKDTDEVLLTVPEFDKRFKDVEDLPLIYSDDYVLVVDKPCGLLSMQKGEIAEESSLEDFGFLVHRLDRGTSGVVILAKDEKTRGMLQRQFQERAVKKKYLAVICGILREKQARIELPIARNLKRPTTFEVNANGREAITEYKVLAEKGGKSLVELTLLTGRTHQIRVHMRYLNTPILGDEVYGGEKAERLFLHAKSLEISIPSSEHKVRKVFVADTPAEFENVF